MDSANNQLQTTFGNSLMLDFDIIIEWDVPTWKRALLFWMNKIDKEDLNVKNGLEIGAWNGGLTCFFAREYGARMKCTDKRGPSEKALKLHENMGVASLIEYTKVDVVKMPFEDNSFDFVVFKSVLGVVGTDDNFDLQKKAINEIYRVLKPGGTLFFAENCKGSIFHQLARKYFVQWGKSWRYVAPFELEELLEKFEKKEIHSTGFFAIFYSKPGRIKNALARLDEKLGFLPQKWKYVLYGYAVK